MISNTNNNSLLTKLLDEWNPYLPDDPIPLEFQRGGIKHNHAGEEVPIPDFPERKKKRLKLKKNIE